MSPEVRGAAQVAPPSLRWAFGLSVCLLPVLIPSGPANTSPVDVSIAVTILMALLWLSHVRARIRVPYLTGVWILVSAGAVAALLRAQPVATLALVQDVFLLAWAAVLASCIAADRTLVDTVCRAWCWTAVCWAGAIVVGRFLGLAWLAGTSTADGSRASLTFGDPNLAGSYYVVCIFIVLASRHPRRPASRAAAVGLLVLAVACTGSNGALLSLAIGGGVSLVLAQASRRSGAMAVIGVACLLTLGTAAASSLVDVTALREQAAASGALLRDSVGRSDESSREREVLVSEGMRVYVQGDPIGVGPGLTKQALAQASAPYVKEAHDDYVATLVERGALGGFGLVVLLTSVAVRLGGLVRRRPGGDSATDASGTTRSARSTTADRAGRPGAMLTHYLVGLGVALVASGTFYEVLHFRHVWAYLGLVAGLHLLATDPVAVRGGRGALPEEAAACSSA
ncbi:O-antigen ligase-like membrane protein [Humibacillus xanthopallidus]|uniref:O-antigen ligase-like membrane protein n=1 Tax=Humibacillus xanthopallidus TaxID=412689 RepID=A0A543PPS9_9MICO|nr:O-antigen ligase family protein [Humibacillus xanthopallidus]TQN46068.1 O-antigen ligase-like membrane protein [Humibacillus xanthopallidus]